MSEAILFENCLAESHLAIDEGRKLETVRNVLLCGLKSRNGYEFAPGAFGSDQRVKELYGGGIPVHLNHDFTNTASRDVQSLAGVIANPRLVDGRPRGDILLADNAAAQELRSVVKLTSKAQGKLKNVGLSHVAQYRFNSTRTIVESVIKIHSVDLVIGPATTDSLFESTNPPPCVPFDLQAALKRASWNWTPEYDPEQALESLGKWGTDDFSPEQALECLAAVPGFDPSKALSGLSFN
jgi:hypothetical protein